MPATRYPNWAIAPRHYPRVVFKFRTIEEAQKERAEHER
jgi:hypothetical protein